jgi:hypothetical protein
MSQAVTVNVRFVLSARQTARRFVVGVEAATADSAPQTGIKEFFP